MFFIYQPGRNPIAKQNLAVEMCLMSFIRIPAQRTEIVLDYAPNVSLDGGVDGGLRLILRKRSWR